jgi:hypothetical protein
MSTDSTIIARDSLIIAAGIWTLTPDDKKDFRDDIMVFIKSNSYSSPEICRSPQTWRALEFIMHKHIPQVNEKWEGIVVQYYTAEIDIDDAVAKTNNV